MTRTFLLAASLAAPTAPYLPEGFLDLPPAVKIEAVSAVALDARDRIYVLHRGSPPLLAFDKRGRYQHGWGEGLFQVPHGLRIDRDGNIWTTDNGNHVLRKFSPEGQLLATLGEAGEPGGGENRFRAPDDVVFSSRGEMYVADSGNGRIVRLSPEGRYLGQWGRKGKGDGEFATAHGLAIDAADRIYVADRGNQRVQVFGPDGAFVAAWGGFGNPFGLLVAGRHLLVSEGDIHKMFHLDLDSGAVAAEWGGPDTLQLPHLMAADSKGRLFVAEVNGKRIQIFRYNKKNSNRRSAL